MGWPAVPFLTCCGQLAFLPLRCANGVLSATKMLHRLIFYLKHSRELRMIGWLGGPLAKLNPHLYADADFAGCIDTLRSTSGTILFLRGPFTSFPIAAYSKRQGCVSHSTPEAEIVSMDFALRTVGLPSLSLWEFMLPDKFTLFVHEDNSAMIRVCATGKNPTMIYLHRTHR